ncbi:MAG: class I SAM-dependent methyltransferase [Thermoanaerobaculia bacterium]
MTAADDSPWSAPGTVAGFVQASPNETLLRFAATELAARSVAAESRQRAKALDLGCGAARNAIPLARLGWNLVGLDLSWPMLVAAGARARGERLAECLLLMRSPMDRLGLVDRGFDLVVAHGIWNLARSTAEFRRGVAEAARVAKPGAGLFVFTFSRETLPPEAEPVAGETFVFTQFSGEPQCFLTAEQLTGELAAAGFEREPRLPWRVHNRPAEGSLRRGAPVIHEAAFRRRR